MGPNPWSALAVVVLVGSQYGLAVFAAGLSWWALGLVAFGGGAFISHAIGVLIHEGAHDLIFKSRLANKWIAILANLPLVFPAAMDFRDKHLKHHAHLGVPGGADPQAPQRWDFEFATSRWRVFAWHVLGPLMTQRDLPGKGMALWLKVNAVANLGAAALFAWCFGLKALLYLIIAGLSAFGHHAVGARRYGEHLTLREGQPTNSYYGRLNWLSFDVGYHVEHHDLPSVPWNRLRALNHLAPELYAGLASVRSWTQLLWQLTAVRGEGPRRYFLEASPPDPTRHAQQR